MTKGYIHSVESMGTVDGKGIRFVVFMQGCAMRCQFCHNPDTWLKKGKEVTVQGIMKQLLEYKVFFDASGGGVTVSGGEPLLQYQFVSGLFDACGKEGINRAVDTSGYCRHGNFEMVLSRTDTMLFSIKVVDGEKHKKLTGVENDIILNNLNAASDSHVEIVIRYVLIPGVNDTDEDLKDFSTLVKELKKKVTVDILAYHKLGIEKWEELGMNYALEDVPEPSEEDIYRMRTRLNEAGIAMVEYS